MWRFALNYEESCRKNNETAKFKIAFLDFSIVFFVLSFTVRESNPLLTI